MSLTGFVLNKNSGSYEDAVKAIDGNICRCTGYKSIERAAKIIVTKMAEKPAGGNISWLVENKFIPAWFNGIESRLQELKQLEADHNLDSGSMIIGGGTDLIVQKHGSVKKADTWHLFDAAHLKGVFEVDGKCRIGASTTVTEFAASPVINAAFPEINKYIKLVSSTPIRNMATLAGNLVNASPIGDMTIFFLALDTALVLSNEVTKRTVMLRDFYKGYKVIDKAPEEYIEQLVFDLPSPGSVFNFEKVCKRTHLDIASVNTACLFSLGVSGEIENIHLAAGGVAPFPKYLFNTVNWLKGKKIEATVLKEALQIMNEEIAPIGDARGSEVYKRLLLRQLFLAHFEKQISDLKNLVTGLPVVSHKI
jgi:xanthine dehydrogenase small subunit